MTNAELNKLAKEYLAHRDKAMDHFREAVERMKLLVKHGRRVKQLDCGERGPHRLVNNYAGGKTVQFKQVGFDLYSLQPCE